MINKPLILGTRGSDLALAQANMTQAALAEQKVDCEIRVIRTIGDKRPDLKLSEFSEQADGVHDKGIFTKELEEALLAGEIDFAVHSLKDVPTELAEPFTICATLPRAPISDMLLTTDEELAGRCADFIDKMYSIHQSDVYYTLPKQGGDNPLSDRTVATSSVRRAALLKWLFPKVSLEDIRGNVPTRIRKLIDTVEWDAIILARAGLQRLGFYTPGSDRLDFEDQQVYAIELPPRLFQPAASQGAVAMEVLKTNQPAIEALAQINDPATFACITAERSFLAALQAGCQTPVGINTELSEDLESMQIQTLVFSEADLEAAPQSAHLTIARSEVVLAGEQLKQALS